MTTQPRRPYPVPAGPVDREIVISKSRFIAWLRPVASRDQALAALALAQSEHPAATHHCYAYLIGPPASAQAAMSDDGEPSGTAGKPIFGVISHKGMSDVLVVVTRYFGGIKLGAGGLVRAYAAAAEAVLSAVEVTAQVPVSHMTLFLDFAQEQPMRLWCDRNGATVERIEYGERVVAELIVPDEALGALTSFCAANRIDASCGAPDSLGSGLC